MGKLFDGIPLLIDSDRLDTAGLEQDSDITVTSKQLGNAFSQFESQNSGETVDPSKLMGSGDGVNGNLKDVNSTGGVVEYITGDRSHSNYREDHGGANYNDHIAFSSTALRDKAMNLFQLKGFTVGSVNDGTHAKGSYHYSNQAFDVKEMTSKVESRVGKTTDSAVRYVLGLMVHKGKAEQIHADGRVLFGKKD